MKGKILSLLIGLGGLFLIVTPALAHVVVKPSQVGIGSFQTFTAGVPNEKDNPTTGLKLLIPEELNYVSPNVKPGWNIEIKKQGDGENAKVTEIDWTGGSIPVGQRDDFVFSAQTPTNETTLRWKAYQTYQDGSVVEWTHDASGDTADDSTLPPYSTTKVVNDLTGSQVQSLRDNPNQNGLPQMLSITALALAAVSLAFSLRKKKEILK